MKPLLPLPLTFSFLFSYSQGRRDVFRSLGPRLLYISTALEFGEAPFQPVNNGRGGILLVCTATRIEMNDQRKLLLLHERYFSHQKFTFGETFYTSYI